MRFVTVATESKSYFPWFVESCKRNGIRPDILGWNEPWKGLGMKIELLKKYLEKLPESEIVCFLDSYDLIVLRDEKAFLNTYINIRDREGKPFVFGSDSIQYPKAFKLYTRFAFGTCKNKLINSGTWIGPAGIALNLMRYFEDSRHISDDQIFFLEMCKTYPDLFYIDDRCEMFLTAMNHLDSVDKTPGFEIEGKHVNFDGYRPCVVHAPGGGNLIPLLKSLSYVVSPDDERTIKKDHREYKKKISLHLLRITVSKLFVFIIVCIALAFLWFILRPRAIAEYRKLR